MALVPSAPKPVTPLTVGEKSPPGVAHLLRAVLLLYKVCSQVASPVVALSQGIPGIRPVPFDVPSPQSARVLCSCTLSVPGVPG